MRFFITVLFAASLSLAVRAEELHITKGMERYDLGENPESIPEFSVKPVEDKTIFGFVFFDRLEQRFQENEDAMLWDMNAIVGNRYHMISFESEGEMLTKDGIYKESRNELLYSYAMTAFWDATVGYRRDIINNKEDKDFAAIGVQGMAPFRFEVDVSSYISDEGDFSAIAEVEYSFRLTQRIQLIPRLETDVSFQDVDQYNTQTGMTGLEFGSRLSYEVFREFAPYVGVSWENLVFETANRAEARGKETSLFAVVIGLRLAL